MESGTVLYCDTNGDDAAIDQARNWLKENSYKPEDVKLLKRKNKFDDTLMTVVVLK